jgi:hypothetical protein
MPKKRPKPLAPTLGTDRPKRPPDIPPLNAWPWDVPQRLPSYKELCEKEERDDPKK